MPDIDWCKTTEVGGGWIRFGLVKGDAFPPSKRVLSGRCMGLRNSVSRTCRSDDLSPVAFPDR